jgi:carbamoyl-phosphate synthase large subunit
MGFSDARLAQPRRCGRGRRARRGARALGVGPTYKRIDTCAAEFASPTAYMYSTYETPFAGALADEARPTDARRW